MPTALCLVSKQPFMNLFDQIMDHVLSRWLCCAEAVFPLLDAIIEHSLPGLGDVFHIRISSHIPGKKDEVVTLYLSDAHHVSLKPLFRTLDVNTVLWLVSSILCERRIIFISHSLETLTDCIFGLLSCIYPLKWQHVLLPVLPERLLNWLSAPMPFIAGIKSYLHFEMSDFPLSEVIIMDLDNCQVSASIPRELLLDLPEEPGWKLRRELNRLVKKYSSRLYDSPDSQSGSSHRSGAAGSSSSIPSSLESSTSPGPKGSSGSGGTTGGSGETGSSSSGGGFLFTKVGGRILKAGTVAVSGGSAQMFLDIARGWDDAAFYDAFLSFFILLIGDWRNFYQSESNNVPVPPFHLVSEEVQQSLKSVIVLSQHPLAKVMAEGMIDSLPTDVTHAKTASLSVSHLSSSTASAGGSGLGLGASHKRSATVDPYAAVTGSIGASSGGGGSDSLTASSMIGRSGSIAVGKMTKSVGYISTFIKSKRSKTGATGTPTKDSGATAEDGRSAFDTPAMVSGSTSSVTGGTGLTEVSSSISPAALASKKASGTQGSASSSMSLMSDFSMEYNREALIYLDTLCQSQLFQVWFDRMKTRWFGGSGKGGTKMMLTVAMMSGNDRYEYALQNTSNFGASYTGCFKFLSKITETRRDVMGLSINLKGSVEEIVSLTNNKNMDDKLKTRDEIAVRLSHSAFDPRVLSAFNNILESRLNDCGGKNYPHGLMSLYLIKKMVELSTDRYLSIALNKFTGYAYYLCRKYRNDNLTARKNMESMARALYELLTDYNLLRLSQIDKFVAWNDLYEYRYIYKGSSVPGSGVASSTVRSPSKKKGSTDDGMKKMSSQTGDLLFLDVHGTGMLDSTAAASSSSLFMEDDHILARTTRASDGSAYISEFAPKDMMAEDEHSDLMDLLGIGGEMSLYRADSLDPFAMASQFHAQDPNEYRKKMISGEVKMVPPFVHLYEEFRPPADSLGEDLKDHRGYQEANTQLTHERRRVNSRYKEMSPSKVGFEDSSTIGDERVRDEHDDADAVPSEALARMFSKGATMDIGAESSETEKRKKVAGEMRREKSAAADILGSIWDEIGGGGASQSESTVNNSTSDEDEDLSSVGTPGMGFLTRSKGATAHDRETFNDFDKDFVRSSPVKSKVRQLTGMDDLTAKIVATEVSSSFLLSGPSPSDREVSASVSDASTTAVRGSAASILASPGPPSASVISSSSKTSGRTRGPSLTRRISGKFADLLSSATDTVLSTTKSLQSSAVDERFSMDDDSSHQSRRRGKVEDSSLSVSAVAGSDRDSAAHSGGSSEKRVDLADDPFHQRRRSSTKWLITADLGLGSEEIVLDEWKEFDELFQGGSKSKSMGLDSVGSSDARKRAALDDGQPTREDSDGRIDVLALASPPSRGVSSALSTGVSTEGTAQLTPVSMQQSVFDSLFDAHGNPVSRPRERSGASPMVSSQSPPASKASDLFADLLSFS